MNVNELIAQLSALTPEQRELRVIVSRDEEGNGFNPLYEVEVSAFNHDERKAIHPEDAEPNDEQAVILWP